MPSECNWDINIAAEHHITTSSNRAKQSYNKAPRVMSRKLANKLEQHFTGCNDLRASTGTDNVQYYLQNCNWGVLKHDINNNIKHTHVQLHSFKHKITCTYVWKLWCS